MVRVLSVTSEIFPLVKTGGLADVAGALPGALGAENVAMRSLVPGYPAVLAGLGPGAETVARFDDLFGGPASVVAARPGGLDVLAIDAPHLYDRPGNPYLAADGRDWPDNALRFGALAFVGARIGLGLLPAWRPEIIHAHDWQAGLVPVYLRYADTPATRPKTVFTIHSLAFQGWFPASFCATLGLPAEAMTIDVAEYHGGLGFMKAGIALADRVTTVSPTYAGEIMTPASGMGLDGLLHTRRHALSGILNGLDAAVWNPAADRLIVARFDENRLRRRLENRSVLQLRFGLKRDPDAPLFGVVSRLTGQKGLDLLLEALPVLLEGGGQLALLGSGDPALEAAWQGAAERHPGQVGCAIGYDEALAHLVPAGADALVIPSRFEPCGLTQLIGLRYGAVPIVARTGGLADTIVDANAFALSAGVATGFQFSPVDAAGLASALGRAKTVWRDRSAWRRIQRNAMRADVSWRASAKSYADLYAQARLA